MKEDLARIQSEATQAIASAADEASLDKVRVAFLGKKGSITAISASMKDVAKEEKRRWARP